MRDGRSDSTTRNYSRVHDFSPGECWEILDGFVRRHRPEWRHSMLEHAKIVRDLCMEISRMARARGHKVDERVLERAAIMHDIGRCTCSRVVEHGIESARILRDLGFDEATARACEVHVGSGIPRDEAKRLGLGDRDFMPSTIEEEILCFCDNLVFFDRDREAYRVGTPDEVVQRFSREVGERAGELARRLTRDIAALVGKRELENFIRENSGRDWHLEEREENKE